LFPRAGPLKSKTYLTIGNKHVPRIFRQLVPAYSMRPVAYWWRWVLLVGLIWFAQPNIKPRLGRGFVFETHPILPVQTSQAQSRRETPSGHPVSVRPGAYKPVTFPEADRG
jgi:hypothetical protein